MAKDYRDAGVVLSSVLSGLASIERMNRMENEEKNRFRQQLVLQDRRISAQREENREDRAFKLKQNQWQTLWNEKQRLVDKFETISDEIAQTGLSKEQWSSFNYIDKTDGMESILDATSKNQASNIKSSLLDYKNADAQIVDLSSRIEGLTAGISNLKRIKTRVIGLGRELTTAIPAFYEAHRADSAPNPELTEDEQLFESFNVDEAEMASIYGELKKHNPEMFGDIDNNIELQKMVRREVLPLYEPTLAKASLRLNYDKLIKEKQHTLEERKLGNIEGELKSLATTQGLLAAALAREWNTLSFPTGKKGNKAANTAINNLLEAVEVIPGIDPSYAGAISQLLVQSPEEQIAQFGKILSQITSAHLGRTGTAAEKETARALMNAFRHSGVLSPSLHQQELAFNPDGTPMLNEQGEQVSIAPALEGFNALFQEYEQMDAQLLDASRRMTQHYQSMNVEFNPEEALSAVIDGGPAGAGGEDDMDARGTYLSSEVSPDAKSFLSSLESGPDATDDDYQNAVLDGELYSLEQNVINQLKGTPDYATEVLSGNIDPLDDESPMLFDNLEQPLWMKDKYDFAGYSDGIMGIGGGTPQFLDKSTGMTITNPHIEEGLPFGDEFDQYVNYRNKLIEDYERVDDINDYKKEVALLDARMKSIKKAYPKKSSGYRQRRLPEILARKKELLKAIDSLER